MSLRIERADNPERVAAVRELLGDYADFLMPGIIVQWMAFGGFATALGLGEAYPRDLKKPCRVFQFGLPCVDPGKIGCLHMGR